MLCRASSSSCNNRDCDHHRLCIALFTGLTKIALTRPISNTVGPRLKTRALRTKEMPRVPRSIALDNAPVWRLRWKPRSRLCRWRKTFLAMRRIELCATLPNTVFLTSLKRAAHARETPSGTARETESVRINRRPTRKTVMNWPTLSCPIWCDTPDWGSWDEEGLRPFDCTVWRGRTCLISGLQTLQSYSSSLGL